MNTKPQPHPIIAAYVAEISGPTPYVSRSHWTLASLSAKYGADYIQALLSLHWADLREYGKLVPYLYRPIAYYGGKVLKCAGLAEGRPSVEILAKDNGTGKTDDGYLPGFIEVPAYLGDRIDADTHATFYGH